MGQKSFYLIPNKDWEVIGYGKNLSNFKTWTMEYILNRGDTSVENGIGKRKSRTL